MEVKVAANKNGLKLPPPPKPKACLFNLILYTSDARRAAYFKDIIRMVTSMFPCRIIFIWNDEASKESILKLTLSSELDGEQQGLMYDQISIETSRDNLERVPLIILPYLIADLPIYLLWGQDPTTESTILPKLQHFATRLIFDSECSENLQHFSQAMLERARKNNCEITDMNWARIRGWKEILKEAFDSEERVKQLIRTKSIKIIYNSRPSDLTLHSETQAFYLQAWLATQLKWKFIKFNRDDGFHIQYENSDKQLIDISLKGENRSQLPPEEIMEFEISDQSTFLYSLVRRDNDQVTVHCNTMDRCELPFTLNLPSLWSGRSFMQEIFYNKTSKQYFRMMELFSKLPVDSPI